MRIALVIVPFVLACSRAELDSPAPDAGCLFASCNGNVFCPFGELCPVGDGCNVCFCVEGGAYRVPGSTTGFSCSGHGCDCTTCGHAGASCTLSIHCCSASCEAGACN